MTDRLELPAEFYDRTSPLLLRSPRPEFIYANFFKASQGADLGQPGDIGMPFRDNSENGADYAGRDDGKLKFDNPIAQEVMATPNNNFQGETGHTMRFNRPVYDDTTYTLESRRVGSNQTISTVPIGVNSEQVTLTLQRFAGPYDTANSRVAPFSVDKFDAKLPVHRLSRIVGHQMTHDYDKFLNSVYTTLADLGDAIYPTGNSADSDLAAATAADQMSLAMLNRVEKVADTANLPVFGDGYRLAVLTPSQCEQLKNDANWQRVSEFHRDINQALVGYVRSVGKLHILKSTTQTTTLTGASSAAVDRGHLLCPGAFLGGMGATPPRVAPSTDDNYGETAKVVWIAYLAMGLADARYVRTIRTARD